jgi:anti-anti-sigma factor
VTLNAHHTCSFPFLDVARRVDEFGDPVFVVRGELDIATASILEAALSEAAVPKEDGAPHRIDVDLRGVRFMDAAGLNALIKVDNLARLHGARLRIRGSSHSVNRLLGITRMDARFCVPSG